MEQIGQISKTDCFAGISREGLTRETLAKTSCLHPILTLCILVICKAHASLRGKLNHEILMKTALVFKRLSLQSLSLSQTTLTNKSLNKYRVHKIDHNYNQIWHGIKANKNIVVNYNFTVFPFGYSVTKPLKQTLDLNVSL